MPDSSVRSCFVDLDGLRLHYLEAGVGDVVLLLHGWPTSSFLWRNVMPPIAAAGRHVVALDLPGFGRSDKPPHASYSFRFFDRILDAFVGHLGATRIGLVVHDLGGPIGLYWAGLRPERVERLGILNTLIYPEMHWAVVAFATAVRLPGLRHLATSRAALRFAMRFGVAAANRLDEATLNGYTEPFSDGAPRRALARAGSGLAPAGFRDLAERFRQLSCPVRVIYGARDRILPDVARTMARVAADLPHAQVTCLSDCGHFLQEEQPEQIGLALGEFFGPPTRDRDWGSSRWGARRWTCIRAVV